MNTHQIAYADISVTANYPQPLLALHIGAVHLVGKPTATISGHGRSVINVVPDQCSEINRSSHHDVHGAGERLSLRFATSIPHVTLLLEACLYSDFPALAMRVALDNQSSHTYFVNTLKPFQSTTFEFGAGPLDGWVHGFHTWCYTGPVRHDQRQPRMAWGWLTAPNSRNTATHPPAGAGQYVSEQVAALIPESGAALIAGFIGMADQFGQVYADGRAGHHSLILQTTADGVPLDPGETRWGEWAMLYCADPTYSDPLGLYAEAVTKLTPGRVSSKPPSPG